MSGAIKLLVYCYEYPPIGGGAGNALAHLSREWRSLGCDVTVITSAYGDQAGESFENGVRVIRLSTGRRYATRGRVREMMRFMLVSAATSGSLYRRIKPDLCIAFMTLPSGLAPLVLHHRFGLPYVVELRGGDVPGFDPKTLRGYHRLAVPLIRLIWRRSASVIANSHGLAELARRSASTIPVQVVPNGVNTGVFKPKMEELSAGESGQIRCIYVGRLVENQKGITDLISACRQLPRMRLVLAGAGPDEARLRALAFENAPGRVDFVGWKDRGDLVKLFQSSDVYVSASRWEGMPNAALEAMSCGLPLVLSHISGHEDLVVKGQNGYLYDPGRPEELAHYLAMLADQPRLRKQMGLAGRNIAVADRGWDRIARERLEIYNEALRTVS